MLALGNSRRRYYQAVTGAVAGTQGVVLPADNPSGGRGWWDQRGWLVSCPTVEARPTRCVPVRHCLGLRLCAREVCLLRGDRSKRLLRLL